MRNIHVLPTDKPSRLHLWTDENGTRPALCELEYSHTRNTQNIYITNDEEIKEGDYFIDDNNSIGKSYKLSHVNFANPNKIILTTDQDLIKDDVQAIDDEFLEWFVNNPSCEEAKVEITEISCIIPNFGDVDKYRIIIPKEEQKQHLIDIMKADEELGLYKENTKCYCGHTTYCDCGPEEPKQETFEDYLQRLKERRTEDDYKYTDEDFEKYKEYISDCCKNGMSVYKCLEFMYFAEKDIDNQLFNREHKQETIEEAGARIYPINIVSDGHDTNMLCRTGFYIGYELAQERSYSEEEVLAMLSEVRKGSMVTSSTNNRTYWDFDIKSEKKWFEQFKKK